jgi:hypothetical protein
MTRTLFAATALLLTLSACAKPVVAPRITPRDSEKECAALREDIARTEQLKVDARADDEFQWRYIFVVNGFVSAYRMNKAEAAAEERLQALHKIAAEKECAVSE